MKRQKKPRVRKRNTEKSETCHNCGKNLTPGQKLRKNKFCSHFCFNEIKRKKHRESEITGFKVCSDCQENKSINDFSKNRTNKSGFSIKCRKCKSEQDRSRRPRRKEIDEARKLKEDLRIQGKKKCNKCSEILSFSDFYPATGSSDGLLSFCKTCSRKESYKSHIKHKFGLTFAQYELLIKYQSNRCAICRKEFIGSIKAHVDHCHSNGFVRGLLCGRCNNNVLPLLETYLELLELGKNYLKNPTAVSLFGIIKKTEKVSI